MTSALGRVHAAWASGGPAILGWCSIGNSYSAEIAACHGQFDAVTVDMQHGMFGLDTAVTMLQALHGHGVEPWARVDALQDAAIMHVLDAGAVGIICPKIESADEARQLVAACRYPPHGVRSYGPSRNLLTTGAHYVRDANDTILALAMIETVRGVEHARAICETPGLDGIYIGPSDLAMSLGEPIGAFPMSPALDAAVGNLVRIAHEAGIRVGIFCSTPEMAAKMVDRGFDIITPGNDAGHLRAGMSAYRNLLDQATMKDQP